MKTLSKQEFIDQLYMALMDCAEDYLDKNGYVPEVKDYFKEEVNYDTLSQLVADKLINRGLNLTIE